MRQVPTNGNYYYNNITVYGSTQLNSSKIHTKPKNILYLNNLLITLIFNLAQLQP